MTFAAGVQNANVSLQDDNLQQVVDTCCLGCVFAKGTIHEGRLIQDLRGCHMGVLDKMKAQGEEIQDATDKNDSEFHVIRGRICPFYRMPNWPGWDKEPDLEKAKAQVRKEVTLKPDVIIYYDNSNTPDEILDTVDALNCGEIRPSRVLIANNSDLRPSQLMTTLQKCSLPWHMETVLEECGMLRALDVAIKKCNRMFVTHFRAGYQPPFNFFKPIDTALYDKLDKFIVLEPIPDGHGINGLTVLRLFHKQADGNARSSIVDKAKKICEEQKCQYLVRPVTEVVTHLSQ